LAKDGEGGFAQESEADEERTAPLDGAVLRKRGAEVDLIRSRGGAARDVVDVDVEREVVGVERGEGEKGDAREVDERGDAVGFERGFGAGEAGFEDGGEWLSSVSMTVAHIYRCANVERSA
jgi:hypothetical protein